MTTDRYVVLGLASTRAAWFRDVSQWAHTGAVPIEFVKCLAAEEVRARLGGARRYSALLVDAASPNLERDLARAAADVGCAVIAVGHPAPGRDHLAIGVAATLPSGFGRVELVDQLARHARLIPRADRPPVQLPEPKPVGRRSPLVAVTGPGGTGASTAAIALAQGLAAQHRADRSVVLADLCLHAEQAMLHDAGDVIPGVEELVDVFRSGSPGPSAVRALTFAVTERGYQLLLGLRRSHAWAGLRPGAFEAALDGLRRAHAFVVADVDADLEGEESGGSVDVEERNVMARTVCGAADVVVVVGSPGMKGIHTLARVLGALLDYGVAIDRLVPVINRAPRPPRARAELAAAVGRLLPAQVRLASPIFLPERRVDDALRDGVRLPDSLCDPLVGAVAAVSARAMAFDTSPRPKRVPVGHVGAWAVQS